MDKSLIAAITGAALLLSPISFAAHVPKGVELAKTQDLVRGNDAEAATLDPLQAEGLAEMHIIRDLFEGLVIQNEHGEVIPGVAKSWENKNNRIYTFHLRKNAKWSNGDPVTAGDFVFALRRAVDPKFASPNAWYIKMTGIHNADKIIDGQAPVDTLGIKALDDHTLQYTLDKPVPYFIAMLAHTTMMPLDKKVVEKYGEGWSKPEHIVSNGAFKLDKWVINERLVMVRNPNYWDDKHTVLNKVTYVPFENQMSAMNRYRTGEIDMTSGVPSAIADEVKHDFPNAYQVTPLLCTYYYAFNMRHEPFNHVEVRKAASYSIMRDVITKDVTKVGYIPAYTFAHKYTANFHATQPAYSHWSQHKRDVVAEQLIDKAHEQHFHAKLLYNTSENHKSIAVAIASMWKKSIGADITLENQEWKSYLAARQQGNFDVMRASWCGDYNEASTFLSIFTTGNSRNYGGYSNPEYDKIIAKATVETDVKKRQKLYDQAEQILAKDMPIAPIFYYMQARLVNPHLGGFPKDNAEGRIYSKDLYLKAAKTG
ncbi:peptide ABC transporter substrate-binding protein [Vibrio sp. S4M6]|uniref:peptide ABC transporter substrate-binding protein n=1 Tax=Vibrio sinus TaxID=2946865 RepID=UPI002029CB52|nr:peptide ABC transporter substrate-binding protein [Vibrio sinus]MCL9782908.1 peptide ABC transporter substrate-binding protein [Vibrio sinus]